jgi:hypothetical protein
MDLPPDPIHEAWIGLAMALGGGLIYFLLDWFVLRHNEAFQRGSKWFRIGVAVLCVGVGLGSVAWVLYSKGNGPMSANVVWGSYAVRALGLGVLIFGLSKMRGKRDGV